MHAATSRCWVEISEQIADQVGGKFAELDQRLAELQALLRSHRATTIIDMPAPPLRPRNVN